MTLPGDGNTIPFPRLRPDTDTLGGRIWRARDALGLSLCDLAARLHLPEDLVSGWERDRAEPPVDALSTLAGVLSVSPDWLAAGIGKAPAEPVTPEEQTRLWLKLARVRELHAETARAIAALESEITRLARRGRA